LSLTVTYNLFGYWCNCGYTYLTIKDSDSGLGWSFQKTIEFKQKNRLKDFVNTFTGIESGADTLYIIDSDTEEHLNFREYLWRIVFPVLKGANVFRNYFETNPFYAIVPYDLNGSLITQDVIENEFPKIWKYLKSNETILRSRENGKMDIDNWHGYVYPKNLNKYESERLIWTDISIKPQFVIDNTKSWHVRTVCSLELNEKGRTSGISLLSLLAVMNSKLLFYYVKTNSNSVRGGYLRYKPQYIKEFPFPQNISLKFKMTLEERANSQLEKTKDLRNIIDRFLNHLQSKFSIEKPSTKLQNWPGLDFRGFLGELKKAKVQLSLSEEADWMGYFTEQKQKALALQSEINRIDAEIDRLVYELYGLTEEEIRIVEGGEG
jgi:hypothetical protein